jgi:hypothetical protein
MNVEHVYFGYSAMQHRTLHLLRYCPQSFRRYEKEGHQIGLKVRRMLELDQTRMAME